MAKSSNKPKTSPAPRSATKQTVQPSVVVGGLVLLVVVAALAYAWLRPRADVEVTTKKPEPVSIATPIDHVDPANNGHVIEVVGDIDVRQPAKDPQLGISAKAVMLLRYAEMLQWREQCTDAKDADKNKTATDAKAASKPKSTNKDKGGDKNQGCTYDQVWSPQAISSEKFRVRKGHENPEKLPVGTGRFPAQDLRIGAFQVDGTELGNYRLGPTLQLKPVPYPVKSADLPANLEISFRDANGALYAGDPAKPAVGDVRVSYRIIPAGKVSVAGTQHGERLTIQRAATITPSS